MRTTLTLEPDVAQMLNRTVEAKGITFKQAVNQALRAGLKSAAAPAPARFRVEPHRFDFKAGIDRDKLSQLADELEAEESARKLGR